MDFLDQVLAVERAWALAEQAVAAGDRALLADAMALGGGSAQLRVRAAAILAGWGDQAAARDLLAEGMADGPPPAPLQIAYARQLRAMGEREAARTAYQGAMLRARPDAALMLELAEIARDPTPFIAAARSLRCEAPREMAARAGRYHDARQMPFAGAAFAIAHARGLRELGFLAAYDRWLEASGEEADEVTALAAHAVLAGQQDRPALYAATKAREGSPRWVGLDALAPFLGERVRAGEPFSWIRLGDGEARFLIAADPALAPGLTERQRRAAGRVIWRNWFGEPADAMPPALVAGLAQATREADLLGIASTPRLVHDPDHFGWCAALDGWVGQVAVRPGQRFTEALFTYPLNEADPFLARLLADLPFLGVISPHPGLAALLGERLRIARTAEWVIPGESRLGGPAGGRHWPDRFDAVMAGIEVPFRGAVFLVAGGLLGKLYCQRIREQGGVALDVGALADAWMGRNTRGSSLDKAMAHTLV